jgi:DNA polymerase-3 subunit epsilon
MKFIKPAFIILLVILTSCTQANIYGETELTWLSWVGIGLLILLAWFMISSKLKNKEKRKKTEETAERVRRITSTPIPRSEREERLNISNKEVTPIESTNEFIEVDRNFVSSNLIDLSVSFRQSETNTPYFICVDVETTGIPESRKVNKNNYKDFPRIVQIAWIVLDNNFGWIKGKSYIIKQTEPIPIESVKIHGITNKKASLEGLDIDIVLAEFITDIEKSKIFVAHNVEFDFNIIKSECMRIGIDTYDLDSIKQYCTMFWSRDICKLPFKNSKYNSYGYKKPTLEELVKYYFVYNNQDAKLSGFHDAESDVKWTAACLREMVLMEQIDFDYILRVHELQQKPERKIVEKKPKPKNKLTANEVSACRKYLSSNKARLKELIYMDEREYFVLLAKMQERFDMLKNDGQSFSEKQEAELKLLGIEV